MTTALLSAAAGRRRGRFAPGRAPALRLRLPLPLLALAILILAAAKAEAAAAHRLRDGRRGGPAVALARLRGGGDGGTEMAFPEEGGEVEPAPLSSSSSSAAPGGASRGEEGLNAVGAAGGSLGGIGQPQEAEIETVVVQKPPPLVEAAAESGGGLGAAARPAARDGGAPVVARARLPPLLSPADRVALPPDSSYAKPPAHMKAFLKRSGAGRAGAGSGRPEAAAAERAPGAAALLLDDTEQPPQPLDAAGAAPADEAKLLGGLAADPSSGPLLRPLVAPLLFAASRMLALASNPVLLCYAASLLGTAVGFRQFLYFSTVGYAAGVAMPVVFQVLAAAAARGARGGRLEPAASLVPSLLVVLWAARLGAFLLWREYVSWPALHARMRLVDPPPLYPTQVLGWVAYSALYLCVASPVLFQNHWGWPATRDRAAAASSGAPPTGVRASPSARGAGVRPPYSRLALALQVAGLVLETAADLQKSLFKAKYRHDWCNVGVWRYSTHPNYVGEALFWVGAHWNGLAHLVAAMTAKGRAGGPSVPAAVGQLAASGAGLAFVLAVLRGAVLHSQEAQARKYGAADPAFAAFQERYGVAGYRLWRNAVRPFLARHAGRAAAVPEAPAPAM
jgi:hypothetical protein